MLYNLIKRVFDVVASLAVLILFSPFLIPIMIGLKFTGEGYIWYRQERIGYKNKVFKIYKFATMLKDSPNMAGGIITLVNDPRITPMGGFLRATKINEIPQLLNVIAGEMSVVGPRPVMEKSFLAYPKEVQEVIYNVKPGLTGIGSIIFRDEEVLITQVKNQGQDTWAYYKNKIYPYKGELEKWYQAHRGLWVDFLIIWLTVWVIFVPDSRLIYRCFPDLPQRPF